MADKHDYEPGPSWWAILLSDWKRSNAFVTVYLRSGAELGPGKVSRIGSAKAGESWQLHDKRPAWEVKWDFDAREVVAVRAEA